ncbi:LEA type 2 family protein [Pseudoxanthomonas dokdonensis]|uniref:Water stress and hypersensitive response domain-containing protein n=1 Tax=Pseudoxanthomonas dokdonensis TaxID=344882 RepID=A0A0R0CFE2_9GAMM|nr:LEA type 2 family protein [Pseudoxanthomonas dokdonensis]KRG68463.1 hypothetical protein ABB29_12615 [Pseudoxanthomonas dokdonensis]
MRIAMMLLLALLFSGCASLSNRDPLNVDVAGVESLPGEGMEMRFAVKLRVQNPNDIAIDYDGAALQLDLNGRQVATGVSDQTGTVPRFGETVVTIPVTVSGLNLFKQFLGMAQKPPTRLDYRVRGKLSGGMFGTRRFSGEGSLDLSDPQAL